MSAGVFVLKDEATLIAMRAAHFATEDDFQVLLAKFPELLVGDQIDNLAPRRFMLVSREQAIPDEAGGAGRWSLDHLFLDQDGIPTLVEVKRSSDTRLRREVVGQMLDYAAHAVVHWPVGKIRANFEARCSLDSVDPTSELQARLGVVEDPEVFWQWVEDNLRSARIRLLFVADEIPGELRRIVEFLNQQMRPAEVLAVELRQFQGEGLRTLVPVVFGQTQEALKTKGGSAKQTRVWDDAALLAAIEDRDGASARRNASAIIDWIKTKADRVRYNDNPRWGTIAPIFSRKGEELYPFTVGTRSDLIVCFEFLEGKPVFGDLVLRKALLERLAAIPGFDLSQDHLNRRPTIKLADLSEASVDAFLSTMDWFAATYRGA